MNVGEASSVLSSSTVGSRYFEHDLPQCLRYLELNRGHGRLVLQGMSRYGPS